MADDAVSTDGKRSESSAAQEQSGAAEPGLVAVVALAGLTGWLGFRAYESRKAE